MLRYNATRGLK